MQLPSVGSAAPGFSLPNQDAKQLSLADYQGKYLCIYFYPKDDTPGCTIQGCLFRDYSEQLAKMNCAILGVSVDKTNSHIKFRSKFGFVFDLLSDVEHKMALDYGIWVEKSMFGRKYMGMQRSTVLIDPKGTVVKTWEKADPNSNAQEVLEYLKLTS